MEIFLERTKTSGPGKRVEVLYAYVASECYLAAPDWLAEGHDLWCELTGSRDFFLPKPSRDLEGTREQEATYLDASTMSRQLFRELRLPIPRWCAAERASTWALSGEKLMIGSTPGFFTEHSERAGMPSAAFAFGEPQPVTDAFGRWSAKGGMEYVRTQRTVVERFQGRLAGCIRTAWKNDPID